MDYDPYFKKFSCLPWAQSFLTSEELIMKRSLKKKFKDSRLETVSYAEIFLKDNISKST